MRETIMTTMMRLLCFRIKSHQTIGVEKLKPGLLRGDVKPFPLWVGFVQDSTVATTVGSPRAIRAYLALES